MSKAKKIWANWYWNLYHWWYRGKWYNGLVCWLKGHDWITIKNFHSQPVTFCRRCYRRLLEEVER